MVAAVRLTGLVAALRWPQIQNRVAGKRIRVSSLAVLSLENLDADPRQDPFAEEMTEELTRVFPPW